MQTCRELRGRPGEDDDPAHAGMAGATNWLSAQQPSPLRDQAIAKFAQRASKLDPDSAAQWAAEIQDEQLHADILRKIPAKP